MNEEQTKLFKEKLEKYNVKIMNEFGKMSADESIAHAQTCAIFYNTFGKDILIGMANAVMTDAIGCLDDKIRDYNFGRVCGILEVLEYLDGAKSLAKGETSEVDDGFTLGDN